MEKKLVEVLCRAGSPEASSLSVDAVDVVSRRLSVDGLEAARLEHWLSPGERERADRLLVDQRRLDFIVARGRLRELLGLALGSHPTDVPLEIGPTGKPMLAGPDGGRVRFNVAHSGGLALYGITLDHDIGIDLERVDETVDWEEIAARSFAPAEQQALAVLALSRRRAAFFDCWVRKEAVIKATGEGLGRRLSSFVVSVEADMAAMLSCESSLGTPESWLLAPVPVPATHRAAVAVRDGAAVTTMRIWS
jgi:4'-phosphopantetheinyl transferase